MKTLLVVGNDRIGALAISKLSLAHVAETTEIVIDESTNIRRVARLMCKRLISPLLVWKMACCDFKRRKVEKNSGLRSIKNNRDLADILDKGCFDRIILFRAGLVISKSLIDRSIPILNIHAAKVPEYGGIGSIQRALNDRAYDQFASLHVVTTRIDGGRVIDKEVYFLYPEESYCANEDRAYQAGIRLLSRALNKSYLI